MATQSAPSEQSQYLGFHIGGEEYAIGILRVREILEYDTVTRVPTTPPSIRGVTKRSCVVVVEIVLDGERTVMGLLADSVSQVLDLPATEIEPPPPFGTRIRVECLLGMGRAGKRFVLLLDIDRLLSTDDLVAAAGAVERSPEATATAPAPAPAS